MRNNILHIKYSPNLTKHKFTFITCVILNDNVCRVYHENVNYKQIEKKTNIHTHEIKKIYYCI